MFDSPGVFRLFLASVVVVHHTTRFNLGTWAVFVFFILSGYWISCMWQQKYRNCIRPARTFVVSRYWRLAPCLLLCIGLYIAMLWGVGNPRASLLATSLTDPQWLSRTVAIVSSSAQLSFLTPKWSIDIEMQFYLAACFVFVVAESRRLSLRWLYGLTGVAVLMFFLLADRYEYPSVTLIPYAGLFCLGALAYFSDWSPSRMMGWASAGVTVTALAFLLCHHQLKYIVVGGPNVQEQFHQYNEFASYLLAVLTVPFAIWTVRQPSPSWDRHLGNLAYPVYLFHMTPILLYRDLTIDATLNKRIVLLLLTYVAIGIGSVSIYWFFDRPIDRLRASYVSRRLRSQQSSTETVVGQPSNA